MIKVAIIEDLESFRNALATLIERTDGFTLIGQYANAEDAIQPIIETCPDICLVDINLPGMNGIQLVSKIRHAQPKILCMMCTAYDEDEKVFQALEAGAHGYLLKASTPQKITDALLELFNGGSPMSNEIARKVVTRFSKVNTNSALEVLTNRENEILTFLSKGLLYKEIALQLSISPETVRKHLYNIYDKLHVNNRTEAVNIYFNR
jgi:two-component system, NarL family, response regulator LiaR